MDKDQLINQVNLALAQEFEVDIASITPEAPIKETLELDSLSLVDMVALIEETFGVEIKGQDLGQIQNFGALYDFIAARLHA